MKLLKKQCNGYWIPEDFLSLGITKTEQFLLAIIVFLSDELGCCTASNSYLAKEMELSESRVSFYLTKFRRLGYIEQVGFNGRQRTIRTTQDIWSNPKKNTSNNSISNLESALSMESTNGQI